MRSYDAIDAELGALAGRESMRARALEAVRELRGKDLDAIDALLGELGTARDASASTSAVSLDADALFEDVGSSRHSMLAPMAIADEPLAARPDLTPGAVGDLAGLLEGSSSMVPPPAGDDFDDEALTVAVSTPVEEEYEEMRAEELDEPLSTEIEILDD